MLFATLIGISLGVIAAKRHGSPIDHASLFLSLIGVSIPIFFLAIIQVGVLGRARLAAELGRQDVLIDAEHPTNFYVLDGIITRNWEATWDAIKHLILPAIALGSIPPRIIARITRASVLDVQNEDYVVTAREGHLERAVDSRHVLRNAMLWISTIVGLQVGLPPGHPHGDRLRLPGIGTWLQAAIENRDYLRHPGRRALRRVHRRAREPRRRHLVRAAQPTHPAGGEVAVSVAEIEARELQLESTGGDSGATRSIASSQPGAIVGFVLVAALVFVAIFAPPRPVPPARSGPRRSPPSAALAPRASIGSARTTSAETSCRGSSTGRGTRS